MGKSASTLFEACVQTVQCIAGTLCIILLLMVLWQVIVVQLISYQMATDITGYYANPPCANYHMVPSLPESSGLPMVEKPNTALPAGGESSKVFTITSDVLREKEYSDGGGGDSNTLSYVRALCPSGTIAIGCSWPFKKAPLGCRVHNNACECFLPPPPPLLLNTLYNANTTTTLPRKNKPPQMNDFKVSVLCKPVVK